MDNLHTEKQTAIIVRAIYFLLVGTIAIQGSDHDTAQKAVDALHKMVEETYVAPDPPSF